MNTHYSRGYTNWGRKKQFLVKIKNSFFVVSFSSSVFLSLKIFEMMDAKARQDCIKEIDLLKVRILTITFSGFCFEKIVFRLAMLICPLWQIKLI